MTLDIYPTQMKRAVQRTRVCPFGVISNGEEVAMADLTPPDHNGPPSHGRASRQLAYWFSNGSRSVLWRIYS